ncbi:DUF397 domain-containing protein [Nucisporomicrobium flavum]|uniref:DUF397 domain-containing protein n=1 Tax=Nucisporomicrobium flavum TaxID=2785915 RepID=UPI0018F6E618
MIFCYDPPAQGVLPEPCAPFLPLPGSVVPTDRQVPAADSAWHRSRRCVGESHCVEVAVLGAGIGLRNSRSPGTVIAIDGAEWQNFLHSLKSGELRIQG